MTTPVPIENVEENIAMSFLLAPLMLIMFVIMKDTPPTSSDSARDEAQQGAANDGSEMSLPILESKYLELR